MNGDKRSALYIGVIVCSVLLGVSGIIGVVGGFSLLGLTGVWGGGGVFGVLSLVVGALDVAAAYGLAKLFWWGYLLAIALNVVGIVLTVLVAAMFSSYLRMLTGWPAPFSTTDILSILVSVGIIAYLLIPGVRRMFKASTSEP